MITIGGVVLTVFAVFCRQPQRLLLYTLDQTFSQLLIVSLVVLGWRGVWWNYDLLYPARTLGLELVNFAANIVIVLMILLVEALAGRLSRWLAARHWLLVTAFETLHVTVGLVAVVGFWRSVWRLLQFHVLPQPVLGPWLSHVIGFVGLALTLTSDTLSERSVILMAGSRSAGVHWPIEYASVLVGRGVWPSHSPDG